MRTLLALVLLCVALLILVEATRTAPAAEAANAPPISVSDRTAPLLP